jgi:hypothetical protein
MATDLRNIRAADGHELLRVKSRSSKAANVVDRKSEPQEQRDRACNKKHRSLV